jgi:hypothetical protein
MLKEQTTRTLNLRLTAKAVYEALAPRKPSEFEVAAQKEANVIDVAVSKNALVAICHKALSEIKCAA